MQCFSPHRHAACLPLAVALSSLAAMAQSAEFTAPPMAERDAVAALAKQGARVQINGEYRVASVLLGAETTNDDLKLLASCELLTQLSMNCPKVTDAGLEPLKKLTKLTNISITRSGITAAGLAELRAALPDCRVTSFGRSDGGPGGFGTREPGAGFGGDRGGFGPGGGPGFGAATRTTILVRNAAVQDDLKLTAEQRTALSAVAVSGTSAALARMLEEKTLAVLTAEQKARLKQLEFQQGGVPALLRDPIAAQLKLSPEQRAAGQKVIDEASTAVREAGRGDGPVARGDRDAAAEALAKARERAAEINKARDEKILAVLNEEQRKAWQAMVGPPGPPPTTLGGAPAGFSGGFGTPIDPAAAAKTVFDRYDADKNNSLTDAEFPSTNRTRSSMTRAGVMLVFPISREEFEKAYVKYREDRGPAAARGGDPGGRGVAADPAATAKSVFDRYDTDKNGSLSDAEFPESVLTRRSMTRAGVMLVFPIGREDFEKAYVKYRQDRRRE
jgi:hypothetical protein